MKYLYEVDEKGGHKKVNWYFPYIIVVTFAVFLLGALYITSTVESNQLRRLNNELTERLIDSTDTCRGLAETIGNCKSICGNIEQVSARDVRTAKEAIELIEETRYYVKNLEMELGYWSPDSIYNGLDNWLEYKSIGGE